VSWSQVKKLIAKMELAETRALEIAEFIADLKDKCGELLDSDILAAAQRGGAQAVSRMLEETIPENERGETRCICLFHIRLSTMSVGC